MATGNLKRSKTKKIQNLACSAHILTEFCLNTEIEQIYAFSDLFRSVAPYILQAISKGEPRLAGSQENKPPCAFLLFLSILFFICLLLGSF